jgi:hypothetical protein
MAINCTMHLATPVLAADIATSIHGDAVAAGLLAADAPLDALSGGDGVLLRSGVWVLVRSAEPHPQDPVVADLGVPTNVVVHFRQDKFADPGLQVDEILWVAITVLTHASGDAVLQRDYEQIWLWRVGPRLILADDPVWTPDRLARVPLPHERAPLAFPDA